MFNVDDNLYQLEVLIVNVLLAASYILDPLLRLSLFSSSH